ncbi:MAG TPA: phospholipase D-like domain-containing protein [Burkholderiaceae bacterium]|nr:phospholipase D-like domain-containing protein [Burkholderiaceae bacterium]
MPSWPLSWISWHTAAVVLGLMFYVLATQGLQQRRPPAAAIAWVLVIGLLPYLGVPLFLLFGTRKLGRSSVDAPQAPAPDAVAPAPGADPLDALARALNLPPAAGHGAVTLHADGGSALASVLQVIAHARRSLHICTYVIGDDAVGAAVLERVRGRVADGVDVRILVDGVGGLLRSWRVVRRLRRAGADVAWFIPPLHRPLHGRTNLRNHRKLVIADGRWLWSGGRNLAAEYFEGGTAAPAWTDLSFETEGPLATELDRIFASDWSFATGREIPPAPPVASLPDREMAQPVPSGPDYADDTLHALLLLACYRARGSIAIATPYFVPDDSLLRALCLAARRGVRVRLLLPARSNHRLADLARHRALQQMTASGVQVRLLPRMLHAKLVAIDDAWLLLGSANIDSRSLFLNYELMIAMRDPATIAAAAAWYEATAAAAQPRPIVPGGVLRDLADGLLLWLAFQL